MKRKPRPHERYHLIALVNEILHGRGTPLDESYQAAYDELGNQAPWLHSQSRDGMAAALSGFRHKLATERDCLPFPEYFGYWRLGGR